RQTVRWVGLGTAGDQVKVGAAVLVCDLPATGSTLPPGPSTGSPISETVANSVTCYSVSGADPARIGATMKDPFTEVYPDQVAGTQAVQIGAIQLLCVPSLLSNITQ